MYTDSAVASESCEIEERQRLYLDVEAGDGAVGHIVVQRGSTRLFSGKRVQALDLGHGATLAGQRLQITANVRQIIPQATWTSLEVRVKGAHTPLDIKLRQEPETGKDITYLVRIDFKLRARG